MVYQDLRMSALNDPTKVAIALSLALDYCGVYMPLFHRPTLVLSSCPSLLLLALCGLGVFLSQTPGSQDCTRMLQKYVWRMAVEVGLPRRPTRTEPNANIVSKKALVSSRVELWILQTMFIFILYPDIQDSDFCQGSRGAYEYLRLDQTRA